MADETELEEGQHHDESKENHPRHHHSIRNRLKHFTWAWYSTNMATGSLAVVLYQTPKKFTGVYTIGKMVFILDLVLFIAFTLASVIRFVMVPRKLRASLQHPVESFFFGTFWVAISLILQNASQYGHYAGMGSWLTKSLEIGFWMYAALVLIVAVFQYETLFITRKLKIRQMVPSWTLPIYPLLVTGPLAGVLLQHQPQHAAVPIFVAAILFQGLGWMFTVLLYAIFAIRLFTEDLPEPSKRPGMYIAVGPTAYTSQAFVTLASRVSFFLPRDFLGLSPAVPAADILKVLGIVLGIFLWLLAFWYFCIATLSVLKDVRKMSFDLSWWGFVFPNAGLTLAAIQIANALQSDGIEWVTTVMTVLLVITWLFTATCHVRAVWKGQILMVGKDEDA